ncbi:hypothetical protein V2J09_017221 [Rumex salicifolius]
MESKRTEVSQIVSTMEELKASKREIQAQHALLGDVISTLETRISTLEIQLRDCPSPQNDGIWDRFEDSASFRFSSQSAVDFTVVGPDGKREHVVIMSNEKIKVLMKTWCSYMDEKPKDIIFLYKGRLLKSDCTPQQLHMEDGDEILAQKRW